MSILKIIELFGDEPIENVLGGLCFAPSDIVYFGTYKPNVFEEKYFDHIKRYYAMKGIKSLSLSYVQVMRNNIDDAVSKLEACVSDGDKWLVDIIGGDDMLLCAAGIVCERKSNVSLYSIDPKRGYIRFSDKSMSNGRDRFEISATVEENITLHSGAVAPYTGSGCFKYDDEFTADIDKMWRLCALGPRGYVHQRSAPQTWNRFVITAAGIEKLSKREQIALLKNKYKVRTYIEELKRLGMVSYQKNNDGSISDFRYKNPQVRECIIKAGNLLEQRVFLTCKKYLGNGLCDVKTGVTISWSTDRTGNVGTENEIDVLAMRGHCPIFISCKNGKFESEELYKLSSVADRFGGKYSKKILVATDIAHAVDAQTVRHLRARARDMGITIIDNVQRMNDAEFEKVLKNKLFE